MVRFDRREIRIGDIFEQIRKDGKIIEVLVIGLSDNNVYTFKGKHSKEKFLENYSREGTLITPED
jgi:hypothetical protein